VIDVECDVEGVEGVEEVDEEDESEIQLRL
jgi:hypothetical protein